MMKYWLITLTLIATLFTVAGSQNVVKDDIDTVLSRQRAKWNAMSEESRAQANARRREKFRDSMNIAPQELFTKKGNRYLTSTETFVLLSTFEDLEVRTAATYSVFHLSELAYPQYAYRYALTAEEWADLQAFCKEQLSKSPYAATEVIAHWRSIAAGRPPFGLRVERSAHLAP